MQHDTIQRIAVDILLLIIKQSKYHSSAHWYVIRTLVVSLQARALRYAFLAEREAAHIIKPIESPKPRQDHQSSNALICRHPPPLSTSIDQLCTKCNFTVTGLTGRLASYTVSRIGVVGSGVMGTGIAVSLLLGRSVSRALHRRVSMLCSIMTM